MLHLILNSKRILAEHVQIMETALDLSCADNRNERKYYPNTAICTSCFLSGLAMMKTKRTSTIVLPISFCLFYCVKKLYHEYTHQSNLNTLRNILDKIKKIEDITRNHLMFIDKVQSLNLHFNLPETNQIKHFLSYCLHQFIHKIKYLEAEYKIQKELEVHNY